MNQPRKIAVLGAGIVGLSTALTLQHAGFEVTVFDKAEPGKGASFGNAGVFADYARLPMASFSNLVAMPRMLMDRESPLSIRKSHLGKMLPYGLRFAKATLPENYKRGGDALAALSELAGTADQFLWDLAEANDLIESHGCLALYGSAGGLQPGLAAQIEERHARGVALEYLDAHEVHDLEPDLLPFYTGGIRYTRTRFAKSPYQLSCRYLEKFVALGGRFVQAEVRQVVNGEHHVDVVHGEKSQRFDAVVLAAGVASREMAKRMGSEIPVVSERGYHLMLDAGGRSVARPVVWLDKSVFLTPMTEGIRVAGTAEFANPDDAPSSNRSRLMLRVAGMMLGGGLTQRSEWVGSRPSMPDSLPVVGYSPGSQRVVFAFGHGHLGLSLSAATGELVRQLLLREALHPVLESLSPRRF